MTVESRPGLRQLAQHIDDSYGLTERGKLIRELVLKDTMVKNHRNPDIAFALSPELLEKYSSRVEDLSVQLGLPEDSKARENSIKGYKGKLMQMGHPHWKVL